MITIPMTPTIKILLPLKPAGKMPVVVAAVGLAALVDVPEVATPPGNAVLALDVGVLLPSA